MEITIYFQKILVPRLFSMKASTHWSMASTWQQISIEYLKKCIRFFQEFEKKCSMLFVQFPWPLLVIIEILTKDLHLFSPYNMFRRLAPCSKCISYPFGVRQPMVGEGCDEAGVHHPERISHALRHFSFFLFSFICCHHRLCKHHLYNQQPCNHSPCKHNFYDHHPCNYHPCIHPLHIHHLQSLHGIFIGEIVASEDDSDPIAPSNSERRSQDVDRCISLIVHSQAADDINNNN